MKNEFKAKLRLLESENFPYGEDGTAGSDAGSYAETKLVNILNQAMGSNFISTQKIIVDEKNNSTNQKVDICILDHRHQHETQNGNDTLRIHKIRCAAEVKLTSSKFKDSLKQLASIKSLTRNRTSAPILESGCSQPKGNIFCGTIYLNDKLKPKNIVTTWRKRIESLRGIWPGILKKYQDIPCDYGRFPNFFWGWSKYVVIKSSLEKDIFNNKPPGYDWHKIGEFKSELPISNKYHTVQYWLGLPMKEYTCLEYFSYRFLQEAHAFRADFPDFFSNLWIESDQGV